MLLEIRDWCAINRFPPSSAQRSLIKAIDMAPVVQ